MHIDTPALFDDMDSDGDMTPGLDMLCEAVRATTDHLALATLAELLDHPHASIRNAAIEALARLHPSSLELRRQLSPRALRRVREALGYEKTRRTRHARKALFPSGADCPEEDEE